PSHCQSAGNRAGGRLRHEHACLTLRDGHRGLLRSPIRRVSGLAHVAPRSGAGAARRCGMIRHLLKLVWHRKRANALVMTEIFFSFLIVFAVATMGLSMISRWRTPLGYEWKNMWAGPVVSVAPSSLPGTHTSTATPAP